MIYKFGDFFKVCDLNSSMFILAGKYAVFSNIIIDKQREKSTGIEDEVTLSSDILDEFGINVNADESRQVIDFNTFYSLVYSPAMSGKWFCVVNYDELDESQKKKLYKYMENPSEYGILILLLTDYKQYLKFRSDRRVKASIQIAYIELDFPHSVVLKQIVQKLFADRGLVIDTAARDLFIARINRNYDDYLTVIGRFYMYKDKVITYKMMADGLKGIENYILDDFIYELTKVMTKDKKTNKKIYKMVRSLLSEYSLNDLIRRIHYKVRDLCEMRLYINKGYIPVGFAYSVAEVQSRLPEKSNLKTINHITFKKLVNTAKETSLLDWLYMTEITSNIVREEVTNLKTLQLLIHRDLFTRIQLIYDGLDTDF